MPDETPLTEAGIAWQDVAGETYLVQHGQVRADNDFFAHLPQLLAKLHALEQDLPLADFLAREFAGVAGQRHAICRGLRRGRPTPRQFLGPARRMGHGRGRGFAPSGGRLRLAVALAGLLAVGPAVLRAQLRAGYVRNWGAEPYVYGAYSYPTVGASAARAALAAPVADTLFFAGKGVYDGPAGGTVEAALVSGLAAARTMLAQWNNQ